MYVENFCKRQKHFVVVLKRSSYLLFRKKIEKLFSVENNGKLKKKGNERS
jgi:hypothetical protein